MQVSFKWEPDGDECQQLMMLSKTIKGGRIVVAEALEVSTGKYMVEFATETLSGKGGIGFAHIETAIRHAEKRLGIYEEPKKKAKK